MSQHRKPQAEQQAEQSVQQEVNTELNATAEENPAQENLNTPELLQARIATLEAQLKDEQLRAAANVQNLTRRHQAEIQDVHKFAGAKFAQEMLPVRDYLEMALADQSGNFDALKIGVDMTLKQLIAAFEKTNIKEINPQAGDILDPNRHQAMSSEENEAPVNTVIRVMQKGYMLNERILRPAMVIVSAGK